MSLPHEPIIRVFLVRRTRHGIDLHQGNRLDLFNFLQSWCDLTQVNAARLFACD
jgi:hypothetical protein